MAVEGGKRICLLICSLGSIYLIQLYFWHLSQSCMCSYNRENPHIYSYCMVSRRHTCKNYRLAGIYIQSQELPPERNKDMSKSITCMKSSFICMLNVRISIAIQKSDKFLKIIFEIGNDSLIEYIYQNLAVIIGFWNITFLFVKII